MHLRPHDGKCLHYYFYFVDEAWGLCYLRVPTWCPFRLQFYCNGHNWLARKLDAQRIGYRLQDNAFVGIEDFGKAQEVADRWDPAGLHRRLDPFARRYCPIRKQIEENYPWSLEEAEYATDIVFQRQADLQAMYGNLIRTAIHTVKPDDIATFLGKKLHGNYQEERGNRYNVRLEGTRVRHSLGLVSIKMYDQFAQILRIETTTKDVSFFRHYRQVEQRDGTRTMKYAPMKKTIYSLGALREALVASNQRSLEFLSALDDPPVGLDKLHPISQTVQESERSSRGFNFFEPDDPTLWEAISRGEFHIRGLQNRSLRRHLPGKTSGQISRLLKRLRLHGVLKKTARAYRYYVTAFGKQVVTLGLKLKERLVIPELAQCTTR